MIIDIDISEEDWDRLMLIKYFRGGQDMSIGKAAEELLSESIRKLHPARPRYSEDGSGLIIRPSDYKGTKGLWK